MIKLTDILIEKTFKPEKRRKLKSGEIEIMKGRGNRQVWFYTKNNSKQKFNKGFFIND